MPPSTSHIGRAITELEAERAHLSARLAKLDEAITTMRALFHLPRVEAGARTLTRRHAAPASNGNGHDTDTARRILHVLAAGAMSPREISARLGIDRSHLRRPLKELELAGVIVATGATANRRLALAGPPAKEVP
jgi:DNA-binding transcriptional ArsR family regulator